MGISTDVLMSRNRRCFAFVVSSHCSFKGIGVLQRLGFLSTGNIQTSTFSAIDVLQASMFFSHRCVADIDVFQPSMFLRHQRFSAIHVLQTSTVSAIDVSQASMFFSHRCFAGFDVSTKWVSTPGTATRSSNHSISTVIKSGALEE